jgi:hypothetical protein
MAVPPVITTIPPAISVTAPAGSVLGTGITYQQFLQSLGTYNYGVEYFYMQASTYPEIGQPVYYNRFLANGDSVTAFLPFHVDPYQSQPAIFYETERDQIIFTGLTALQFKLQPTSTVYFKFFATILYIGNDSNHSWDAYMGTDAFKQLEQEEGITFFDDYCNYLIDESNDNVN